MRRGGCDTLVLLDTSSLLCSCWEGNDDADGWARESPKKAHRFWEVEFRGLASKAKVILPKKNYEELEKHSRSSRPGLAMRAGKILEGVGRLAREGAIEIIGDENDPFADAVFLSVSLKFRTTKNLVFVTQDRDLAMDLLAVADFSSVRPRGHSLEVARIAYDGSLVDWRQGGLRAKREEGVSSPLKTKNNWWEA